jgi:hypothetical protein
MQIMVPVHNQDATLLRLKYNFFFIASLSNITRNVNGNTQIRLSIETPKGSSTGFTLEVRSRTRVRTRFAAVLSAARDLF